METLQILTDDDFSQAIALRLGANVKATPEAQGLAERSLRDIEQIYEQRASSSGQYDHTTSNAINQTILAIYTDLPKTWNKLFNSCEVGTFTANRTQPEPQPAAEAIPAGNESPMLPADGYITEWTLENRRYRSGITAEMFHDDETGAIANKLRVFANSAVLAEETVAYAALEANGTLGDALAMYHATHGSLATSNALDAAGLAAAMKTMRYLKSAATDAPLLLEPKSILVPPDLERTARGLMAGWKENDKFNVVVGPLLSSTTTWYLFPDKRQGDTVVMGFLRGNRNPSVTSETNFDNDDLNFRFRHIVGAAAAGYAGVKCTA